jgi:hypothetical protein
MSRNRIPRRNLSARAMIVARMLQDRAWATYASNVR